MSDEDEFFDNLEIESKTWNQMEKSLKQHGFREGASGGREATFQSGFDEGYRGGFRTGKALGFAKGSVDCLNSLFTSQVTNVKGDARLENPSKGSCIMCFDKKLEGDCLSLPFDVIVEKQKEKESEVLTYVDNLKIKLKNESS